MCVRSRPFADEEWLGGGEQRNVRVGLGLTLAGRLENAVLVQREEDVRGHHDNWTTTHLKDC